MSASLSFSIVTPSYNALPELKKCVGSVRNIADVKLEHIIQDGDSDDGTKEWLLKQTDLISNSEPDHGMYDAINKGWSKGSGDILSWLNADEQYLPGTLQSVQVAFNKNPDIDVVWGYYICVDPSGNPLSVRKDIDAGYFMLRNGKTCYIGSSTVFFRRQLWDSGLLQLSMDYRYSADKELYLRLLRANARFLLLKKYFSLFEVSSENLSARYYNDMAQEGELIRQQYPASPAFFRFGSQMLRKFLKLCRGAYRESIVQYPYVVDEDGASRIVTAHDLAGKLRHQITS